MTSSYESGLAAGCRAHLAPQSPPATASIYSLFSTAHVHLGGLFSTPAMQASALSPASVPPIQPVANATPHFYPNHLYTQPDQSDLIPDRVLPGSAECVTEESLGLFPQLGQAMPSQGPSSAFSLVTVSGHPTVSQSPALGPPLCPDQTQSGLSSNPHFVTALSSLDHEEALTPSLHASLSSTPQLGSTPFRPTNASLTFNSPSSYYWTAVKATATVTAAAAAAVAAAAAASVPVALCETDNLPTQGLDFDWPPLPKSGHTPVMVGLTGCPTRCHADFCLPCSGSVIAWSAPSLSAVGPLTTVSSNSSALTNGLQATSNPYANYSPARLSNVLMSMASGTDDDKAFSPISHQDARTETISEQNMPPTRLLNQLGNGDMFGSPNCRTLACCSAEAPAIEKDALEISCSPYPVCQFRDL
ncbi:unnamed protein product [Protopolystoma xenopodis]|uniref:Uncharacterized protein n=1 Tax=Protopolystoma xenopodis TaxID=117903 RepID=A0A3S5AYK1_9PLAT|nr:unnamed protein product [Protopolystoma xenopodis]